MRRFVGFAIVLVVGLFGLTAQAAVGATEKPVSSANEVVTRDSADQPLVKFIQLSGQCGANSWKLIKKNVRVDPYRYDRGWVFTGTTRNATGSMKTNEYAKNSFNKYNKYYECRGHSRYHVLRPVNYVHRMKYVNMVCHDLGCRHSYTWTSGWREGYCSSTRKNPSSPWRTVCNWK